MLNALQLIKPGSIEKPGARALKRWVNGERKREASSLFDSDGPRLVASCAMLMEVCAAFPAQSNVGTVRHCGPVQEHPITHSNSLWAPGLSGVAEGPRIGSLQASR